MWKWSTNHGVSRRTAAVSAVTSSTRQLRFHCSFGVFSTPCRVLDVTAETAAVRLETPWFVDHFHMGRFDGRWVIVNALWHSKPR